MKFYDFYVAYNDDGKRLDKIITKLCSVSVSLACKNIRSGFIRLNGDKTEYSARVKNGDKISIEEHLYDSLKTDDGEKDEVQNFKCNPLNKDFTINSIAVFKNSHVLILNKPYGMLSQKSSSGDASLDIIVQHEFELNNADNSLTFKPGPLHRLDRYTSGILCFSQSLAFSRWFTEQMKGKKIKKTYLGIVQGNLTQEKKWVDFVEKNGGAEIKGFFSSKVINSQDDESKKAVTIATPLSHSSFKTAGKILELTLVQFQILTGKNHQIRLQSSFHGFPLLGDTQYGGIHFERHFLHCYKLEIPKNEFGVPEIITAMPPEKFSSMLENFDENSLSSLFKDF